MGFMPRLLCSLLLVMVLYNSLIYNNLRMSGPYGVVDP